MVFFAPLQVQTGGSIVRDSSPGNAQACVSRGAAATDSDVISSFPGRTRPPLRGPTRARFTRVVAGGGGEEATLREDAASVSGLAIIPGFPSSDSER